MVRRAEKRYRTLPKFRPERIQETLNNSERGSRLWYIDLPEGISMWKCKEDENYIRVLPSINEEYDYGLQIYAHFNIGADNSAFLCPRIMRKESCPICEEVAEMERNGEDRDIVYPLMAKPKVLFLVIDRDEEDKGVRLFDAPYESVGRPMLEACFIRKTGETIDITDPEKGFDFTVHRKGTGIKTRYKTPQLDRDSSELGDPEWLEDIVPFDEVLLFHDYDAMKAELLGHGEEEGGEKEEEEEESLIDGVQRNVDKRDAKAEESEEEEGEEEEEEKPEKKSRARSSLGSRINRKSSTKSKTSQRRTVRKR